jgi:hypothetical protein
VNAKHACLYGALTWLLLTVTGARADNEGSPRRAALGFLRTPAADTVKAKALAWLKNSGKADEQTVASFEALWAKTDRSLLDRVADTFALADSEADRILGQARTPNGPAPKAVPDLIKNLKGQPFFRANLALAYAKALCGRPHPAYEEALEALRNIRPEQVVDPAAYFFHRAVAEHALLLKSEASRSLASLMDNVVGVPERYQTIALLMRDDMESWRDKDLGAIARKMGAIAPRLELARGGPRTQKMQRDVINRLDEIIKRMENPNDANGGSCPNGGQPGGSSGSPNSPMPDSNIALNSGPGNVDQKKLKGLAQQWGKLPDKERAKAMQDLIRGMPERRREVIENYFKKLAQTPAGQP